MIKPKDPNEYNRALKALQKRLHKKHLSYREVFAIIDEIAKGEFDPILTTYFAASDYVNKLSRQEIYYLTKALVETGRKLSFPYVVADKHSIGGVPGTRVTLIIIPLLVSLGIKMVSTPSRAITSPSGTADDMELLAKVEFKLKEIPLLLEKAGGCIVWGGHLDIAPVDTKMIEVEKVLFDESMDKVLVSIMAKKVASGVNHVVIEIPIGREMKVTTRPAAQELGRDFIWLGKQFGVRVHPVIIPTYQPAGGGIGPYLETREALRVLQQKTNYSRELETRALHLADQLLGLILKNKDEAARLEKEFSFVKGRSPKVKFLKEQLANGRAWEAMKRIILAQGGQPKDSEEFTPQVSNLKIASPAGGSVRQVLIKNINKLSRLLGTPEDKQAGIYLYKKLGENVRKGEVLFEFFSSDTMKLKEAKLSLETLPIYKIK